LLEDSLPLYTPEGSHPLLVSAKSGDGIEGLKKAILDHAGWHPGSEGTWMARERQILALSRAMKYLERAESVVSHLELFAEELRLAQETLGEITGEFLADDLLGEIFSRFCIGK
jgi:tRNA modification GTPase